MHTRREFLKKSGLVSAGLGLGAFDVLAEALSKTSLYSRPSDLEISDIKCGFIRGGHGLFVKIYSNQDIWGCGEGVDATPGTYHLVKLFAKR
ncbi:MAG: twin-arginine translocation signal domain-containing protein, partial [Bacteroidota bacterium]